MDNRSLLNEAADELAFLHKEYMEKSGLSLRRKFERWLASNERGHSAFDIWLAGYKCAEICDKTAERHYNVTPDGCANAIRATIKEE